MSATDFRAIYPTSATGVLLTEVGCSTRSRIAQRAHRSQFRRRNHDAGTGNRRQAGTPSSASERADAVREQVDGIERGRAADEEPVPLGAAETDVGDDLGHPNLADQ